MRWRRRPEAEAKPGAQREPERGGYPESFVQGWMARTLPSATPAEAARAVRHLHREGWTEQQLAAFILPYMPREAPSAADEIALPPAVTEAWLDEHLPALDRRRLRLVVDELERRRWPAGAVAMAVLPHLLPKLPPQDARAVVAGLAELGLSDEEIARATARR